MTVEQRSYRMLPGESGINDPALAYVTILSVDREGLGHEVILTGSAGNREALYDLSYGSIRFLIPAEYITGLTIPTYENVDVIFKY